MQAAEPDGDVRRCPFAVGSHVPYGLTPVGAIDQWVVASIKTNRDRLEISVEPDPAARGVCRLTITAAPVSRTQGTVQWRISKVLRLSRAIDGRAVRLTLHLRADSPIALDTAALYIRDARSTTAIPLRTVGPEWQTVSLTRRLVDGSPFEIGLRLLNDKGTIQPAGAHLLRFATSLDVDMPAHPGLER